MLDFPGAIDEELLRIMTWALEELSSDSAEPKNEAGWISCCSTSPSTQLQKSLAKPKLRQQLLSLVLYGCPSSLPGQDAEALGRGPDPEIFREL